MSFILSGIVPNNKLNKKPVDVGFERYEFSADEWNQLCQDTLDLRTHLLGGFFGLAELASSPLANYAGLSTTHLWARNDGALIFTRGGVDTVVSGAGGSYLPLVGGTMAGSIGFGTDNIYGVGSSSHSLASVYTNLISPGSISGNLQLGVSSSVIQMGPNCLFYADTGTQFDWHNSNGTFKTPTGVSTFGGSSNIFTNKINVHGYDVDPGATVPSAGQVLAWSGAAFVPTTPAGATLADIWFSPADLGNTSGIGGATLNGNISSGAKYQFTRQVTFTAVKFFWNGAAGLTIKCSFWDSTGTRVASGTVVTTGSGLHTCTMGTPYALPASQLYKDITVSMWENSGTKYQTVTIAGTHFPESDKNSYVMMIGPAVQLYSFNYYSAGDAMPATGGPGINPEYYPVSPVFTVP